jgi:hypothetical protein
MDESVDQLWSASLQHKCRAPGSHAQERTIHPAERATEGIGHLPRPLLVGWTDNAVA